MADPADMGAVAQGHGDGALRAGALDALPHGLLGHGLAEAALGIEHQHAAMVGHQLQALVGDEEAFMQQPDIVWQHSDAVAVVAGKIGRDQMLGDVAALPHRCCPWRGRR